MGIQNQFCKYLPFTLKDVPTLSFFSERGTRELACFFAVAETVLGSWLFFDEIVIGLIKLWTFFVESMTDRLIFWQERDANFTVFMESWQNVGFYNRKKNYKLYETNIWSTTQKKRKQNLKKSLTKQATIKTLLTPPRESCNMRAILLSL